MDGAGVIQPVRCFFSWGRLMCSDNETETWSVEKFVVWLEFYGRTSFLHRNSRLLVQVYGDGVSGNAACQNGRTGTSGLTNFGKPTNRNSRFIRSFGVAIGTANDRSLKNWIIMKLFAGHEDLWWKGRKIGVLRELVLISDGLLEKETSSLSESDWPWGMGAPCHSSKENKPECGWNTQLHWEPKQENPNFAVLLERLWRLYFWMQTDSATLKPCLGPQRTRRTRTAARCDSRLHEARKRTYFARCYLSARQCTPRCARRTQKFCSRFTWNCWTIDSVVLTLCYRTLICLGRWSNTIMRKWKCLFIIFKLSC